MPLPACTTIPVSQPNAPSKAIVQATQLTALAKRIDNYIAPIAATSDLSGTIYVKNGGEPPLLLNYGFADWSRAIKNTNETRYSAASITKGITAATLVSLQRDGEISLEAPVGRWLPTLAGYPEMTLHAILQHRAGLPRDFSDDFNPLQDNVASWLSKHPEKIKPAGKERYSNIGYALLAEVIAIAQGRPYAEVAREFVLEPAGMKNSIIQLETASTVPGGASPYTAGPEPAGIMTPAAAPLEVGSSGLIATAADLALWARSLADGAYPELFLADDPLGSIDTGTDGNGHYVSVQGTLPGYNANAIAWRDRDLTISFAGNLFSYPALNMATTLRALVSDAPLESPYTRPLAVALSTEHIAIAGRYKHPDFGTVEITYDDGRQGMRLTMPGKPAYWSFYLTPIENGGLHWRAFGNILRADDGSDGLSATVHRLGKKDRVVQIPVDGKR